MMLLKEGNLRTRWTPFVLIAAAAVRLALCAAAEEPEVTPLRPRRGGSSHGYRPGASDHLRYPGHHDPGDNVRVHLGPVFPAHDRIDPTVMTRSRAHYAVVDRCPDKRTVAATSGAAAAALYRRLAESALRQRHYNDAIRFARHALVEDEGDGKLHVLLTQALLADGQYDRANTSLRQGLALLSDSDISAGHVVDNRVVGTEFHVRQVAALTSFLRAHPQATFARFLRGYQYALMGRKDAACADWDVVMRAEPADTTAARLLQINAGADMQPPLEELPAPAPRDLLPSRAREVLSVPTPR